MSHINAIGRIDDNQWEVDYQIIDQSIDLNIGFKGLGPVVEFSDLKFKYEILDSGKILSYDLFPPSGSRYIRSDQFILVTKKLLLPAETDCTVYLWAENNRKSFETTIDFKIPRPPAPFPSWKWNGSHWVSPIEYPQDVFDPLQWDEETLSWVAIK